MKYFTLCYHVLLWSLLVAYPIMKMKHIPPVSFAPLECENNFAKANTKQLCTKLM